MIRGGRAVIEAQAAVKTIRAGAFCTRCGAWLGCLGLEPTFDLYIEHMVEVFADVHRVLRRDGTLWLNLGDCYATGAGAVGDHPGGGAQGARWAGSVSPTRGDGRPAANGQGVRTGRKAPRSGHEGKHGYIDPGIGPMTQPNRMPQPGLKPKDLVGIPWRVALALQDDGWWLRMDVVWSKPNPMPESVTDRPTKAHEYVFLLTKSETYFYDATAIAEPSTELAAGNTERKYRGEHGGAPDDVAQSHQGFSIPWAGTTRNRRSVWTITTQPFEAAHFAVMPEDLAEPCVKAGTSERGCCPACRTPWERIVERTRTLNGEPADLPAMKTSGIDAPDTAQGVRHGDIETVTKMLGWAPGCRCYGTSPLPPLPKIPSPKKATPAQIEAARENRKQVLLDWKDLLDLWRPLQTVPCDVLDPFGGSGTVPTVALRLGRQAVMAEMNPEYAEMARRRIEGDAPLLNRTEVA